MAAYKLILPFLLGILLEAKGQFDYNDNSQGAAFPIYEEGLPEGVLLDPYYGPGPQFDYNARAAPVGSSDMLDWYSAPEGPAQNQPPCSPDYYEQPCYGQDYPDTNGDLPFVPICDVAVCAESCRRHLGYSEGACLNSECYCRKPTREGWNYKDQDGNWWQFTKVKMSSLRVAGIVRVVVGEAAEPDRRSVHAGFDKEVEAAQLRGEHHHAGGQHRQRRYRSLLSFRLMTFTISASIGAKCRPSNAHGERGNRLADRPNGQFHRSKRSQNSKGSQL